ncbi:MAG: heme ABC transporter ATP-binding protein [Acidimicrobiia bacterium]|nr:heme ABC transporter ATP-binding protein [Acidimicrobiia bacterium]MYC86133.1 heme ABC transporter ATP-binding protein [Acidimicrobiia bacterium]
MTPVVAMGIVHEAGGRAILDGINLQLETGMLTALVGPNGAGKSTLLGILAGDIRPTRGSILVQGCPIEQLKPARLARIRSVLPQKNRLEFAFSVRQVVELGRFAHAGGRRISRRSDVEAVESAMSATGVASLADMSFPTLSVGEQALVMIARILAQDTPVLILDEPTASLDIRHEHRVMNLIRHRARQGGAVIAVLHDLNLAARYADRIGMMAGGRLHTLGPPGDVLQPTLLSEVYDYPIEVMDHPSGSGLLVTTSATRRDGAHRGGAT